MQKNGKLDADEMGKLDNLILRWVCDEMSLILCSFSIVTICNIYRKMCPNLFFFLTLFFIYTSKHGQTIQQNLFFELDHSVALISSSV